MEQDPPLLPVAYEKMNDAWYNYVKGQNPQRFLRYLRCRTLGYGVVG